MRPPDSGTDDRGVRSCRIVGTRSPDLKTAGSGVRDFNLVVVAQRDTPIPHPVAVTATVTDVIPVSGLRSPVSGLRSPVSGFRVPGSGFRSPVSGYEPETADNINIIIK